MLVCLGHNGPLRQCLGHNGPLGQYLTERERERERDLLLTLTCLHLPLTTPRYILFLSVAYPNVARKQKTSFTLITFVKSYQEK